MPTSGNAAASTALPQPPRTNQKVPRNSAASFAPIDPSSSLRLRLGSWLARTTRWHEGGYEPCLVGGVASRGRGVVLRQAPAGEAKAERAAVVALAHRPRAGRPFDVEAQLVLARRRRRGLEPAA